MHGHTCSEQETLIQSTENKQFPFKISAILSSNYTFQIQQIRLCHKAKSKHLFNHVTSSWNTISKTIPSPSLQKQSLAQALLEN